MSAARLVFVGGLHRSGTTLLAEMLAEHPEVGGLHDTGVPHDEGQHLQSYFPTAADLGGPGHFALDARAHLTEADVGDVDDARRHLLSAWAPHWDTTRARLIEKSPPNLLRFRALQAIFPDSFLIAIGRHPVAVAYATEFWAERPADALFEHWLHAHELFERDRPALRRLLFLRYETVVADPNRALAEIDEFLGIAPHATDMPVRTDTNARYFARFRHHRWRPAAWQIAPTVRRYETRLAALDYAYSFHDRA